MEIKTGKDEQGPFIILTPSEEGGGFFRFFGSAQIIARMAILRGMPETAVDMIERGDMDLFNHFVAPNQSVTGAYYLRPDLDTTVQFYDESTHDWDPSLYTGFREFAPYSHQKHEN